jgi:acyl-CoA reductase-like NAD-dependent aldehyde dehydrogenase
MLINSEWVTEDQTMEVRNPYNGELVGTVPEATDSQLNDAIEAATQAFKKMKRMPAHERAGILARTSELIGEKREELAETITLESGKPITLAEGEVQRATETFRFAAESSKQIYGESIPMDAAPKGENHVGFTLREPIGVIGAISPFNFPLNLVAHKVAPAIAAGNTVVLKPASYTPLTSIKLGEIMLEAGIPDGALNIVTGPGSKVGNAIVTDPRIGKITFTGSPSVGQEITRKAGIKRITLELGSNSAVVIDDMVVADPASGGGESPLRKIVSRCVFGSFANAGQVCISVQRIYVHENLKDDFTAQFVAETNRLRLGNPLDPDTDVGPMITISEAERAKRWIDEASTDGARIMTGGSHEGTLFEPTVLVDTTPEMKVVAQEVFAPVVSIMGFEDWDSAIELVNSSDYGLNTGVYTSDVRKAFQAAQDLEAGGVMINDIPTYRVDHMPYGGVKKSGIGREGIKYAIEEMTQPKFVCFNL